MANSIYEQSQLQGYRDASAVRLVACVHLAAPENVASRRASLAKARSQPLPLWGALYYGSPSGDKSWVSLRLYPHLCDRLSHKS